MERTALVISGGTARGAYAAGLLDELFRTTPRALEPVRIYSATSTGALIAPALALFRLTGDTHLLDLVVQNYQVDSTAVWTDRPRGLLFRLLRWVMRVGRASPQLVSMVPMLLESGAMLDTTALEQLVHREYRPRLGKLLEPASREQVTVLVNAVSAQSGELEVYSTAHQDMTVDLMLDAIYASCLQPVVMPLKRMRRPPGSDPAGPDHELMDGGIRDVVPIDAAMAAGATRILALSLFPEHPRPPPHRFYSGTSALPELLMRVVMGLLNGEVQDDDVLQGRLSATIGRLVLFARSRGATDAELEDLLSALTPAERARLDPTHGVFSDLYVHRPAPEVELVEELTWTAAQMRASIDAGRAVARSREGARMLAFLGVEARADTPSDSNSQPVAQLRPTDGGALDEPRVQQPSHHPTAGGRAADTA